MSPLSNRPVRRLTQLLAGLLAYGVSTGLMLEGGLGSQPWDVLHQGLSKVTGISVGVVGMIAGALVLLCWIPLRQRPGIGTIANILVIGPTMNLTLDVLPTPHNLVVRLSFMFGAILLCGLGSGLYIGANLGPGPRDGLMTGLAKRGYSIRLVRTCIEVVVVIAGFALGGVLGIGTLLYAVSIGPLAHITIPLFTIPAPPKPAPSSPSRVLASNVAKAP